MPGLCVFRPSSSTAQSTKSSSSFLDRHPCFLSSTTHRTPSLCCSQLYPSTSNSPIDKQISRMSLSSDSTQPLLCASQSKNDKLHLLTLPAEILTMIMKHLLIRPGCIHIPNNRERQRTWNDEPIRFELAPQVMRVCKQLFDQGIPLLYSRNIFLLDRYNDS
jgi:hypothetical protein